MAVNVAARQLADPRLPALVAEAQRLAGRGAPLCVEVTETALLTSATHARSVLALLRRDDAHVALDDVGTGYSARLRGRAGG